ncbi:TetR/AcrR family transcriptional regulator [Frondihabitans australicus]|uniref:TetR family transcriptional regulator n=1 Tax=Frondihabitans australicus TaxID=386892 RepID=A0A495IH16_9MICO|nr:TetR/AcrR family transcriptional regulator [Frondihabitans australicus]RKR75303.1 TetR family transcriptional regulator [Frondihabitans australicus]
MAGTMRDAKRAESSRRILEAARAEFAEAGFEAATIRSIAGRAGVTAGLVMQHYGSKEALFRSAARLPADDRDTASEHVRDVLDARLGDLPPETLALLRSMLTVPEAADAIRAHLDERIDNLTASLGGEDARARATVAVTGILGLTIARQLLRLRAFDEVSREAIVDAAERGLGAVGGGE